MLSIDLIRQTEQDFREPERYVVRIILTGIYMQKATYADPASVCQKILNLADGDLLKIVNEILPLLRLDSKEFERRAATEAEITPKFLGVPFS